jgi:serine protease
MRKLISILVILTVIFLFSCTPASFYLVINTQGNGTVNVNPSEDSYPEGTIVSLSAVPNTGWEFVGWSGDLSGNNSDTSITMDSDKTVTAQFEQKTYTLTVNITPTGGGTVTPSGGTYNHGQSVTLTASPNSGYQFVKWSGAASGTSLTTTITMNANKNVTAEFQTSSTQLSPPTNLTASKGTYSDKIELTWNAVTGAQEYHYFYSTSESGTYTEFGTPGSGATINVTGVTQDTHYWFKVKASKTGGVDMSNFSNADYGYSTATTNNYTLSGNWYSADENDEFTVSTAPRLINTNNTVKTNKQSTKIETQNTTTLNSVQIPSKTKDYNKQAEMGAFRRIQIIFKDKNMIIDRNGSVPQKYEKYGELKYYPNNPIPELTTLEPTNKSNIDWNEIIDYYNSLPEVEIAGPDYIHYPFWTPNDTFFSYQWQMQPNRLNMPAVWDITTGSSSVKVAVIDSGLSTGGEDTPINIDTTNQYNFTDEGSSSDVSDNTSGHGTHVTGTIAQATNNNKGVAGMAPNVTILPLRVFSNTANSGSTTWIMNAIQHCIDLNNDSDPNNNVHVINMSLGSVSYVDTYYGPFQTVITNAFNAGIAIFAATGNSAEGWDTNNDGTIDEPYNYTISYPAAYNNVMAVGATDYNNQRSYYSQYGSGYSSSHPTPPGPGSIDIVAPGGDVTVDLNGDSYSDGILQETNDGGSTWDYLFWQGTSMATPHVAGLAGLIKSVNSSASPQQIYDFITSTASTSMTGYNSNEYGAGIINPLAAIQAAQGGSSDYYITDSVTGNVSPAGASEYWEINVNSGTINLTLSFTHADNDLDLFLYDPSGTEVASSETTQNSETISYSITTPGTYKIRVYWWTN